MIQIQRQENSQVTDYYLNIIARMCGTEDEIYEYNHEINKCKKNDIIIVATVIDFLKAYIKGFRKIIYWMQGIDGEESYLKHHSICRKLLLDLLILFALKKAKIIFFVSEEMKRYEEKKYKLIFRDRSFVMPCFNVSKEHGLFFDKQKYKKNIFCYVGSLSKWQCFSQMVDFYKTIEDIYENVELKVFTNSKESAKNILSEKKIKNFTVDWVPQEKLTEALKEVKFGFVLRENISVNNVATPTKLSSYLSAGVIPIYSDCLIDFFEKTQGMKYVIPLSDFSEIPKKLDKLIKEEVEYDILAKEYSFLFSTYYNPDYYINMYRKKLLKLLDLEK